MKKYILLVAITALVSCNGNKDKDSIEDEVIAEDSVDTERPITNNPESKLYVWKADYDYTKVQNPSIQPSQINADSLIKGLNGLYENVFLEKEKISGDTIYTFITNSDYLANQMGSTGAEVYIADAVLNLAEVPGVKYVSIKMKEGSHAQSGVWTKQNFEQYKTVKE